MTKKIIPVLLMLVFLFTCSSSAFADGISDDQIGNYAGVTDYRKMDISKDPDHKRPKAGFSLQIKSEEKLGEEVLSGKYAATYEERISATQDSPVIKAGIGDSIVINDRSTIGSGTTMTGYDIQYRFVPKGEERTKSEITPTIVGSFSGVKNIIENLKLEEAGTYEIFMAVQDNAECLAGASNWSANGNLRVIAKNNKNFPAGVFWYFTEAVVEVGEIPDFYPTPEGSDTWQESYKDCAKTYEGKTGEQISFPVNLYNVGSKGTTDYRAVWYGQGDDPLTGWAGSEPVWEAAGKTTDGEVTDLITMNKGEYRTYEVIVTVPDKPTKLYFKANVDGKTPESEEVKDNNTMAILIQPDGIDLAITSPKIMQEGALKGQKATVNVSLSSFRNDIKEMSVEGIINWKWTKTDETTVINSGSKTVTLNPIDWDNTTVTVTGYPGDTFYVIGEIMPTTEYDIDLSNNKTKTKVYITLINPNFEPPATKIDSAPGTRVNLRD